MPTLLLVVFISKVLIGAVLRLLNFLHTRKHGAVVPVELASEVSASTLERISAYTFENMRFGFVRYLAGNLVVAVVLFGGALGAYDRFVREHVHGFVWEGVAFFAGLNFVALLCAAPFDLYSHFSIEQRHGFNRMSFGLWLGDFFKSLCVSLILISAASAAALGLVAASPGWWWLLVWLFFSLFELFLLYVSPYLIEPLFFRMKPLAAGELAARVRALGERTGVHVSRVLEVDASRRSSHSNAYFTGVGRVKRVVLFDTLLERMTHAEIIAVLAHELGHWKKHHILQRLIVAQVVSLGAALLAFRLLAWNGLPGLVGLEQASFAARVVIVAFGASLVGFAFTPLASYWSRRHEWQADRFARELTGDPQALASALAKLSRDNLSNLHPHPLFAAFYYSHPLPSARVRALREAG